MNIVPYSMRQAKKKPTWTTTFEVVAHVGLLITSLLENQNALYLVIRLRTLLSQAVDAPITKLIVQHVARKARCLLHLYPAPQQN